MVARVANQSVWLYFVTWYRFAYHFEIGQKHSCCLGIKETNETIHNWKNRDLGLSWQTSKTRTRVQSKSLGARTNLPKFSKSGEFLRDTKLWKILYCVLPSGMISILNTKTGKKCQKTPHLFHGWPLVGKIKRTSIDQNIKIRLVLHVWSSQPWLSPDTGNCNGKDAMKPFSHKKFDATSNN